MSDYYKTINGIAVGDNTKKYKLKEKYKNLFMGLPLSKIDTFGNWHEDYPELDLYKLLEVVEEVRFKDSDLIHFHKYVVNARTLDTLEGYLESFIKSRGL